MKKRLVIIFVLALTLLFIQVYFYQETIARANTTHVATNVKRVDYILKETIDPIIKEEKHKKFEKTELRIESFIKLTNKRLNTINKEKEENIIEENPTYTLVTYPTEWHLTASAGVFWYGDQKETYYNLPMDEVVSTAWNNGIKGDYWIRDDGCKMLGDYIILACNRSVHPYGSIVMTSLGNGISLDTGGFADVNPYQVDIAVNW